MKKPFVIDIVSRIDRIELTQEMMNRIRIVLLLSAILAFFIAFQMGDDWYVREYADYDWARHIGY